MNLKQHIPWQLKIGAKLILSRLPVSYHTWQGLKLFRHGGMDRPAYALDVFRAHYNAAFGEKIGQNFTALELGPGDSLFSALIARAFGASRIHLVDVQAFANCDIRSYIQMAEFLSAHGFATEDLAGCEDLDDILEKCSAQYLTRGVDSLRIIEDASVDFIWSHSVLQHVRKKCFRDTVKELRRILRPGGVASHRVDLRDCLGGSLNNLRFSERTWESSLWVKSGFYTNRIRYTEMLEIFRTCGFNPAIVEVRSWHKLPIPQSKMDAHFSKIPETDLLISGFNVVLH